jgi:hypothetical protein
MKQGMNDIHSNRTDDEAVPITETTAGRPRDLDAGYTGSFSPNHFNLNLPLNLNALSHLPMERKLISTPT